MVGHDRGVPDADATAWGRLEAWRRPLRERPFRRYFVATLINSLGSAAGAIALAFGVLDGGSATDLGLVFFGRELASVALLLAGGVWADRLPRRAILAAAYLAEAAATAGIAALLWAGAPSTSALALLAAIGGGASAFARPAQVGYLPELVSADNLQAANALKGSIWSSTTILGAVVGAGLVAALGPPLALAIDAATFVVAALLILGIERRASRAPRGTSPLADLREGWVEFRSRTWVWVMVLSFAFFQLSFFPAMFVLGPVVAKAELHGVAGWGVVVALQAVGSLVGSLAAVRIRTAFPLRTSAYLFAPVGLVLVLLGTGAPLAAVAAGSLVTGFAFGSSGPFWFTALQRAIPDDALSRVSSFDELGSIVLNPIGWILVGPLAAAGSAHAVLVATGVAGSVVSLAVLLVPSVRDLRLEPP